MAFIAPNRVLESTTTEGTGPVALTAVEGYDRLSQASGIVVGDVVHYLIQAVNAVGKPLPDWEVGRGTYSAANELTRTTVVASSNSDAAVNFGPGTKQVAVTILSPMSSLQIAADWRAMLDLGKSAVLIDSATGGALVPTGTTAQRGAATTKKVRINDTTGKLEFSNGTRWQVAGGATGGEDDQSFFMNNKLMGAGKNMVVPADQNAGTFGPFEIPDGTSLEILDGGSWTIV